ncbi:MAG: DUF5777 family beta-barrel protein [Saprospiraceae bacterium]
MKKLMIIALVLLMAGAGFAQTSGFDFAYRTFRGTRVVNGHSVEMHRNGELDFLISHRFGSLNGGAYELFGLDQATIRFGLEYGLKDWINIGVGRSSYGKHYDGYLKMRFLRQAEGGSWVTLTGLSSIAINTLRQDDYTTFARRLSFNYQLLVARKLGEKFSIQLMPTFIHYNLVFDADAKNDLFTLGVAGKWQVTKNLGLVVEYYPKAPNALPEVNKGALAIGFDINTGSHVFQLHLTNTQAMIEKAFIGETTGDWMNGDIYMGFNISRVFKLKGRRY